MGEQGTKWERKTFLDLCDAGDLSILDVSVSNMNELLKLL